MKACVTEIIVSAGRTFNHPYESYANFKPQVTLKAALPEGEDVVEATKELQRKAEELVEDHKTNMLKSLRELQEMTEAQQHMARLSEQLQHAQKQLDALRSRYPGMVQAALPMDPYPAPPVEPEDDEEEFDDDPVPVDESERDSDRPY